MNLIVYCHMHSIQCTEAIISDSTTTTMKDAPVQKPRASTTVHLLVE